jgi:tetratricopeptide (TPR) repeat protein
MTVKKLLPPLLVFILALAVRLHVLAGIEAYPKFELIRNRLDDQVVFDIWAKSIVAGRPFDYAATGHEFATWAAASPGVYPQAPLYPYWIALLYELLGFRYDLVRAVQMGLGAVTAVLVYLLALRFVRRPLAVLSGIAVGLFGPFVFYEATFLRAGLFSFVAALGLVLLMSAADHRESRAWHASALCLCAGLVLAAGVLLRANYILFALAAVGWLYGRRGQPAENPRIAEELRPAEEKSPEEGGEGPSTRHPRLTCPASRARAAGLALAGLAVPVILVAGINSVRSGRPAFISSNGPYIFFIGNVHDAHGNSAGPSPYYYEIKSSGPPETVGLFTEALRDIVRHPWDYLRLQLWKAGAFFGPRETPNNLSYAMARKTNPRLGLAFLEFHMLLPAALLGMAVSLWHPRRFALLYLFVVLYSGSTIALYVLSRLRQPVVVSVIVFAGVALGWWWDQLAARRFVRLIASLLAVLAANIWLWPGPAEHRLDDYRMAAAAHHSLAGMLERDMRMGEAARHYARAVALNPDHRKALLGVLSLKEVEPEDDAGPGGAGARLCEEGRAAAEAGRFDEAVYLLREAASRAPGLATPHHYLSNVHFMTGDRHRAMEALEAAVERDPANELYRKNLKALRGWPAAEG